MAYRHQQSPDDGGKPFNSLVCNIDMRIKSSKMTP